MKLIAFWETGERVTLTIGGEWRVVHGERLDRLTNSIVDHFFTKDGHYDGYGVCVADMNISRQEGFAGLPEYLQPSNLPYTRKR